MADALTAPPRAAQVGKTSLILSLVGEEFPAEVRGESGRSRRYPSPGLGPPSRRVPCRSLPAPRRSPFPQTSPRRRCLPTSWITQVERVGPELRPCAGGGGRASGQVAVKVSPLCRSGADGRGAPGRDSQGTPCPEGQAPRLLPPGD